MKKEDIIKKLNSDPEKGLSEAEVKERQEKGLNVLVTEKKKPLIIKFFEEFKDVLIIILIVAAVVSLIVDPHHLTESMIIFMVVILNALLGVYQENKAEKSLEALMKLSSPMAKVVRNSEVYEVESKFLVLLQQ